MKKIYLSLFALSASIAITAVVYYAISRSNNEILQLQMEAHKRQLVKHEADCNDLEVCLEAELSYSEALDNCYPIDPLWGWPGEKSEGLLTTCKLFKRIRRVSGQ